MPRRRPADAGPTRRPASTATARRRAAASAARTWSARWSCSAIATAASSAPFLRKGHPVQSGPPTTSYTEAQTKDLSHFLHERVNDTLRGSPIFTVQNVLTGNRQAGETWFNGAGGCRTCHSPTGDLAGIGTRYDPPTLQQRLLFPLPPGRGMRGRPPAGKPQKPVTVRVTTACGQTAEGALVYIDDFNVSLRDAAGHQRSCARTPDLKVVKNDPYAAHIALLDVYTDANMHDIVAYLESLK